MAEDFDKDRSHIEDNETIPDLLVLKQERDILNYYDNEFESTPFAVQEMKGPLLQEESQSRHFQPPSSNSSSSSKSSFGLTNNENKLLICNKIVLGSKPNRVSSVEGNLEESGKIAQEKSEVSIDVNYFEELVASYDPSVELQDIKSYLHKSKRFCDSCSILFPDSTGYESHMLIFHSENSSPEISRIKSLTERRQHKCTICAKQFVNRHVLRKHLITIHKVSNDKAFAMTTKETRAKGIEDTSNDEAIELSTKETSAKGTKDTSNAKEIEMTTNETSVRGIDDTPKDTSVKIIVNSIKETNATVTKITTKYNNEAVGEKTIKETNTPKITHECSDLSNTCCHCKKAFDTQKSLIEHLYDILQMKRKNTEIVPVLKSVLFKCHKCDIHFTSSQLAANHAEHMEMLINWKCSICNRIFKKEDELSHERQHSVSNNFLIYNLGDLDVANILFRCSKCATHFTESNFLYHFRDCGLDVTKSFTCKTCNILLDYTLKTLHEFDKHTESKLFTIIQCDVISDNPVKSTVNKPQSREKLKELLQSFREVKIVLEKIDSGKIKSSEVKFSSNSESRSVSESSSVDMASNEPPKVLQVNKASDKLWATRLRKSDNTTGRYRHAHGLNKNKAVNLKLLGRRNMTYSYCKNCKCFITKFRRDVHLKGRCNKLTEKARTCEQCGLILSNISIMAHKRLHMERKDLKLTNFRFKNLFNGRPTNPPIPEYPKCTTCEIHFLIKKDRINHICNTESYQTCDLCGIKLSEAAFKLHMAFHDYATERMKRATMKNLQSETLNIDECESVKNLKNIMENNSELINNQLDVAEPTLTENTNENDNNKLDAPQIINKKMRINIAALRRLNVTYCYCETCKCFVTKFKKTVHIQGRCKNMAKIACTCDHCGLILTSASMVTHKRLHIEKKDLKLNNFRFFNLYTGRSMNPPIPEYPRCTNCDVHFLTMADRNNHNCNKEANHTCYICETKLSETAFKFHMTFHQYATDRSKRVKSKNLKAPSTLDVINSVADEKITKTVEKDNDLPNNLKVAETNVTAIRKRRNISQKYEIKGLNVFQAVNKKRPINNADLRTLNLTYFFCGTCKCFVTKFRKTAHVQGRCKYMAKTACMCELCGLILTSGSIDTHRRLHMEKKDLQLKHFRFFDLYNGQSMNPPIPDYPKCNTCAVHFLNKELSNNHICNAVAHQKCHLCDINISEAAFKLHVRFHEYETVRINRITSKNSQTAANFGIEKSATDENVTVSTENNIESTHNRLDVPEMQLTANTNQEYKSNDKTNLDTSLVENKIRLGDIADHLALTKLNVTYSYCENCKCFITKHRIDSHVQGNCKKLHRVACTCEDCGLILNDVSILTHKRLHEENKDLKLKNFKFFNIYTGIAMNPPVPEYPKCKHCAVHFLTKTASNKHICSQQTYQSCRLCEMKLSQAAFKRHMSFHQYASDSAKRVTMKNTQSATTLVIDKRVTNEDVSNTTENKTELICNPLEVAESPVQHSSEAYEIVYTCGNCSVSVDTYDKVVEHCQRHYENENQEIKTNVCNHCKLTIDAVCYMDHYNIHEKGKQFKFLKFDSYFLPADNNIWVTHIFKTLPKEKVLNILRSSIYRFECRIKMEVIQQGDPDLTVYRCDQCNCFIEPGSLFKHSDNSCFKLRQHPCTICGIPFNSSASRIDHEKIHNRPGVTTDLYRIVVFNRERDKQINRSFCLRKNYVLFQCRNCSVIIDKLEGNDNIHKCDVSNVKKCQHCELLIHTKDFEKHVNTHQEFVSFNYSNMKVILIGEDNFLKDRSKNTLASYFKGAIYDYKMFICNKCGICIKDAISMSKHICRFGKQRLKCLKCNLYFSVGRLKTHTRSHEQDPDFIRSNMNIVSFDPCTFDQNKNTTVVSKESEYSDSNTDLDTEVLAANDANLGNVTETFEMTPEILEEETVKLYKCTCELHFLNEDSIIRHFGVCRSMAAISKQKCPKCDLLFTSNVLFTHLLAHHRKHRFHYKFDVIEMDYIQNRMV